MRVHGVTAAAEAVLGEVRARGDRAAALARSASPLLLASAEELYAGYRVALERPESFARGSAPHASSELAERSIRAEFAVALGVSERVACRELENARLLVEDLPATRSALAEARLRWEAGQAVCAVAATLPPGSRAEFDARAADLAARSTPTQLRRALARLREELHEQPLADRHRRAREDRAVWLSPEVDGMATLCALLPAPVALGAYARLDRIARILRDGPEGRESDAEGREPDAGSSPSRGSTGETSAPSRNCGPTPWPTSCAMPTSSARSPTKPAPIDPLRPWSRASGPRCASPSPRAPPPATTTPPPSSTATVRYPPAPPGASSPRPSPG
ncbi:DUF222 domain-containing protein [Rathayibacter tritici]|nr:DUF222 domain-containing protein [Rathayibacter tritici]